MKIETQGSKIARTGTGQWWKIALFVVVAAVVVVAIASFYAGRFVRRHLVEAIENHYHAHVELKDFSVLVFPRIRIIGEGLVMRQEGATDVPPFISIARFTTDASIFGLLHRQKRIGSVTLEGLEINVATRPKVNRDESKSGQRKKVPDFVIDKIDADGTKLRIIPKDPQKDPLVFDIQKLNLRSAGTSTPMTYEAVLTNAEPPGVIHSTGSFGPWNAGDPGQTPLAGHYRFRDADLSVFHGIVGKLSSDGQFGGVLEKIVAEGTTDVPDFSVRNREHPVRLQTTYHAVIDGTNGDTDLEPVNATFLNSHLVARGKVEGTPGKHGKTISLKVDAQQARIEDLLKLVVASGEPPLTGSASFSTKFVLPPGDADVIDKLELDGSFGLEETKFTDRSVQHKIATLSHRARGDTDNNFAAGDTASDFHGHFSLSRGTAHISDLSFVVPGAKVNLHGTFNIDTEELDFHGQLAMDAKLSETTTGVKSFFARLVQPLFSGKHGKNTVVPIKISGTREHPKFGLDVGKVLSPK